MFKSFKTNLPYWKLNVRVHHYFVHFTICLSNGRKLNTLLFWLMIICVFVSQIVENDFTLLHIHEYAFLKGFKPWNSREAVTWGSTNLWFKASYLFGFFLLLQKYKFMLKVNTSNQIKLSSYKYLFRWERKKDVY